MAQNATLEQIAGQFKAGSNCAQIMAVYFAGKFGEDEARAHQFMCSFGGGMRQGDVCGAVTGGLFALSMKAGNASPEETDRKAACYADTIAFGKAFRERYGSMKCQELLAAASAGDEYKGQNLHHTFCPKLVLGTIELLEEMGY